MNSRRIFDERILPHLDSAYNLARWLLRHDQAAEDAVQEASIRAYRHIDSLRDGDARPWLLGIVRNTCFTMLERQRNGPEWVDFDEGEFDAALGAAPRDQSDPAVHLEVKRVRVQIDSALRALSPLLREVTVLRELEELEYAQIAVIVAAPIGTVMSRLSRAREKLRIALSQATLGE